MSQEQFYNHLEQSREGVIISCSYLHNNSCYIDAILTFFKKMPNPAKAYFLIHLLQTLILKRKKLFSREHGLQTLKEFIFGFIKSMIFVMLIQVLGKVNWCYTKRLFSGGLTSSKLLLIAPLCYLSIFLEKSSRIAEISMYVVPKYIESIPVFLEKMQMKPDIPYASHLLMGFSMGLIANVINTEPRALKYQYFKMLEFVIGGSDKEELEKVEAQKLKNIEMKEVSKKTLKRTINVKKVHFENEEKTKAENA